MSKPDLVGVDIGGTKCAVILGTKLQAAYDRTSVPKVIDRTEFPTEAHKGPSHALARILKAVTTLMRKHHLRRSSCIGIGVCSGGPLDSQRGIILSPPNLPGWDDIPIGELFERRLGIRTRLENDANACALAEYRYGAGIGSTNMVFLTFGTGLGAGLILDGKLYGGSNGMAGEVGHIRLAAHGPVGYGKAGSFEGFASGGGIAALARDMIQERLQLGEEAGKLGKRGNVSAKDVALAAAKGDALAKKILSVSGEYLGRGLAILVDTLNPDTIVIGSIYARCEHLIRPSMMRTLAFEALERSRRVCRIIPARLGDAVGDIAALELARMAAE